MVITPRIKPGHGERETGHPEQSQWLLGEEKKEADGNKVEQTIDDTRTARNTLTHRGGVARG